MNKDIHTTQQQLGTSEKGENMPQCEYLMHNQKDESDIINELSLNSKIHQTSICQAKERNQMLLKVSSIRENLVMTTLQPIYKSQSK